MAAAAEVLGVPQASWHAATSHHVDLHLRGPVEWPR